MVGIVSHLLPGYRTGGIEEHKMSQNDESAQTTVLLWKCPSKDEQIYRIGRIGHYYKVNEGSVVAEFIVAQMQGMVRVYQCNYGDPKQKPHPAIGSNYVLVVGPPGLEQRLGEVCRQIDTAFPLFPTLATEERPVLALVG